MIRYLLVEGLPSVNVATTTDNKKITPRPFLQFLIALGENFSVALIQECMEVVSCSMPKMGHRVHKSYASVLVFAKLVRKHFSRIHAY